MSVEFFHLMSPNCVHCAFCFAVNICAQCVGVACMLHQSHRASTVSRSFSLIWCVVFGTFLVVMVMISIDWMATSRCHSNNYRYCDCCCCYCSCTRYYYCCGFVDCYYCWCHCRDCSDAHSHQMVDVSMAMTLMTLHWQTIKMHQHLPGDDDELAPRRLWHLDCNYRQQTHAIFGLETICSKQSAMEYISSDK